MSEAYLEGNRFYKEANYDAAYDCYSRAISANEDDIRAKAFLNRAACCLKLRNFDQCLLDCSAVLKADPHNTKARLRRAIAQEDNGNYSSALDDVLIALESARDPSLLQLANSMSHRLRHYVRADLAATKEDRGHASFITGSQTTRLCIARHPPRRVSAQSPLDFDFFLANELGLWSPNLLDQPSALEEASISIDSLVVMAVSSGGDELIDPERLSSCLSVHLHKPGKFSSSGKCSLTLSLSLSDSQAAEVVLCLRFSCNGVVPNPVLSLPICVSLEDQSGHRNEAVAKVLSLGESVFPQCITESRGPSSIPSFVFECPGYVSIGGKIWDATFALMDYLSEHDIRGKRVVELGCGTGVLALSLASLNPASVILTDTADVINLAKANIELNAELCRHQYGLSSIFECRYRAVEYIWGSSNISVLEELCACDLVLAADVVYDPDSFSGLIQAMHDLLQTSKSILSQRSIVEIVENVPVFPKMILAFRNRGNEECRFLTMLAEHPELDVRELPLSLKTMKARDVKLLQITRSCGCSQSIEGSLNNEHIKI